MLGQPHEFVERTRNLTDAIVSDHDHADARIRLTHLCASSPKSRQSRACSAGVGQTRLQPPCRNARYGVRNQLPEARANGSTDRMKPIVLMKVKSACRANEFLGRPQSLRGPGHEFVFSLVRE